MGKGAGDDAGELVPSSSLSAMSRLPALDWRKLRRLGAFHHEMRRHTRWLYKVNYSNGEVRVGNYYNASPKCDTIRFRHIKDGEVWWDLMIRPDEAILMAAALVHVAGEQLYATKRKQYKASRKAARTRKRGH